MKEFDISLLKPELAIINANLFQNTNLGITPTLFFEISVPFKNFHLEGKERETEMALQFIKLPIQTLSSLYGKKFEFPINPEEGYIDGSIYLFHKHNPVDVTQITFGYPENGILSATLNYDLLFEFEKTGYGNLYSQEIEIQLKSGRITIDDEIQEECNMEEEKIKQLLSQHFTIENLVKESVEGEWVFNFLPFEN